MVKFFRAICECDAEGRWQEAEPIPYDEWVKLATHRARTRLTRRELEEIGPQLDEEIRQALAPARQMPGMWNAEEAEVLAVARACSSVRRYKAMTALGRGDMRAVYDIIGWMTGPERVTTCSSMVRRGLPVVQGDGRVVVRMSTLVTFGSVGEFADRAKRELRRRVTTAELEEASQAGLFDWEHFTGSVKATYASKAQLWTNDEATMYALSVAGTVVRRLALRSAAGRWDAPVIRRIAGEWMPNVERIGIYYKLAKMVEPEVQSN